MMRKTVVALALSAGVLASGSALAEPAKFDGTWSVSLVGNGGLCGSRASSTGLPPVEMLLANSAGSGWVRHEPDEG